jgi:hypothetical protein
MGKRRCAAYLRSGLVRLPRLRRMTMIDTRRKSPTAGRKLEELQQPDNELTPEQAEEAAGGSVLANDSLRSFQTPLSSPTPDNWFSK